MKAFHGLPHTLGFGPTVAGKPMVNEGLNQEALSAIRQRSNIFADASPALQSVHIQPVSDNLKRCAEAYLIVLHR